MSSKIAHSPDGKPNDDKVYVVLLNYRGWRDTLECLESVLKLSHANMQILVVDNDSCDDSVDRIIAWAAGTQQSDVENLALAPMSRPACRKPISLVILSPGESIPAGEAPAQIVLIRSDNNDGYAAGNNLGIALARADPDCAFIWLLNNDTVVATDALSQLLIVMHSDPLLGICGSTLVHYHNPATVQALGGARFNRWLATSYHVGEGQLYSTEHGQSRSVRIDYVVGASMFVSRAFVEHAGPMYEGYFLYFEEIDWSMRRGPYGIGYAPLSVVFHKEGGSTGMSKRQVQFGVGGDFYMHRNRLVFTRRNFPLALPIVVARLCGVFLKSVLAGRRGRVAMFLRPDFWFGSGKV
ncbi:glycosyltransferase family 2 protein [Massilia sp. PWRC2]|uniref:glycosyltransferase family 2 protein n=1 Tax=Massilia sp. PWRC2 TaxID=2804626 RepID=UPI003CF8CA14